MKTPRTTRLRFRPCTLEDAADVYALFGDPYARRFYPESVDHDAAMGWIRWNLRNYDEHGFGLWALELSETGEFVGDCGITMQQVDEDRKPEVGYHVVEHLRRRGLATEAALACRDWALERLRAPFVCSIVHAENLASKRVAERIHEEVRPIGRKGSPHLLYYTER
jgi:RimJ/RimL family protein N-acetyltransferase